MKNFSLFTFLILVLIGCQTNDYKEIFKLNYKNSSVLRFHVTNCSDTLNYTFYYWNYFPMDQPKHNISFYKDSIYQYTININHPVTVNFSDSKGTDRISFFSLPSDTLDIFFDANTSIKFSEFMKYQGQTASISNYLTKGKLIKESSPRKEDGIDYYNKQVDTLTQERLNALSAYIKKEPLPNWFVKFEKTSIDYLGASNKIEQFSKRIFFYNQYLPKPCNFIENLGVKIDNPDAIFSERYLNILYEICPQKYDTLLQPEKLNDQIFFQYIYDNNTALKNYLKENMSFFLASRISGLLRLKKLRNQENLSSYLGKVDSLISSSKPLFADTTLYNYLLDYRNEQILTLANTNKLKKGDKAPSISLKGLDNKLVHLTDFSGQYVVINFWATWCASCIKSIDEKNKLHLDYNKKELVFFNVCLDNNEERWKKIIHDKNFQGTHAICKGKWQNVLTENYNINGIPHYALIDRSGNIIADRIENLEILENLLKEELK